MDVYLYPVQEALIQFSVTAVLFTLPNPIHINKGKVNLVEKRNHGP